MKTRELPRLGSVGIWFNDGATRTLVQVDKGREPSANMLAAVKAAQTEFWRVFELDRATQATPGRPAK